MRKTDTPTIFGPRAMLAMVCLVALGAALFALAGGWADWSQAALAGWLGAGLLGILGLWGTRRAMLADERMFMVYVLGGLLVRLICYAIYAGIVLGNEWLDKSGFILGLLVGVALFVVVEIAGIDRAARQKSRTMEGAMGRG